MHGFMAMWLRYQYAVECVINYPTAEPDTTPAEVIVEECRSRSSTCEPTEAAMSELDSTMPTDPVASKQESGFVVQL